jgi:hemoglobin
MALPCTIMNTELPSASASDYTPPGGPPQVARPDPGIFRQMGEENIYRMAEDFYRELEASDIRPLFPEDMPAASRKQAMFLIGILGGPPRYQEKIGPPRLRARHLPFQIDEPARQTWLACFKKVLEHPETYAFPRDDLPGFIRWLEDFSAWMVNRA